MAKPLRDYQRAMLEYLRDHGVVTRETLRKVGVAACDPHFALGRLQTHRKEYAEKFEGLSTEQRLAEIEKQRHQGAVRLVDQAFSHLETRGLTEVVDVADDNRHTRLSWRITEKGRKVLEGVSPRRLDADWLDAAKQDLKEWNQTHEDWTSDEYWEVHGRPLNDATGRNLFLWGQKQGFMEDAGDADRADKRHWRSLIFGEKDALGKTCELCGKPVDPMDNDTFQLVEGWMRLGSDRHPDPDRKITRAARTPALLNYHDRFMCQDCLKKERSRRRRGRTGRTPLPRAS